MDNTVDEKSELESYGHSPFDEIPVCRYCARAFVIRNPDTGELDWLRVHYECGQAWLSIVGNNIDGGNS